MKLLPLDAKQKIYRRMNWFQEGSAVLLLAGSLFSGVTGMFIWERIGSGGDRHDKEKITLQEKVDHLLETNSTMRSFNAVTTVLASGRDFAIDPAKVKVKQDSLKAAFNAEEEAVGVALAHAQYLSPHERTVLYWKVRPIASLPSYLQEPNQDEDFIVRNHVRKKLESEPGFTPTIESAKEITSAKAYGGWILLSAILGSPILGIASVFGFHATRKRLGRSIAKDEALKMEQERDAREAADARKVAEAVEAERVAKLPPSVSLDRDIAVKQIRIKLGRRGP